MTLRINAVNGESV